MIRIEVGKDWLKVRRLMRKYPQRLAFASEQLVYEVARRFLDNLKDAVPSGDEFKEYVNSLKVVQITGATGGAIHAVVSERTAVKLDDISQQPETFTLVYIEPKPAHIEKPLPALVALNSPWPIEMIPEGLKANQVQMIHRGVSRGEYDYVKESTAIFLLTYHAELQQAHADIQAAAKPDSDEGQDPLMSMPDYMWQGLRAEFGINTPSRPHWRPALQKTVNSISSLVDADKIKLALYDEEYRGHLTSERQRNPITAGKFVKEAGVFEGKVSSLVRLEPR